MAVYVDVAQIPYGRMKMSHMMADSRDELLAMAERIGVPVKHIQAKGTYREHFDVCEQKARAAVALGAQRVGGRRLAQLMRQRRDASQ